MVRAGSKRLVLGVTQHQITALAELAPEPAGSALPEIDDDQPFAAHLERAEGTSADAAEPGPRVYHESWPAPVEAS